MIVQKTGALAPKTTIRGLSFLIAMLGSMMGSAGAGTVDVYFIGGSPVTVTGAGVVGQSGDQWNGITTHSNSTSGSNISLDNTSGQSSGVLLSYAGAGGDGGPFYSPIPSPNPNLTSTYADSFTGSNPNNVISLSLSGLTLQGKYELYVYDVADYHVGTSRPGVVTLATANGGTSANFNGNGNLSTWVQGSNYILLTAEASGSGVLSFTISPTGGNHEVDLNGFQLVSSVPEPSSIVLLGLAGVLSGVGLWRLRQRPVYR
jgi:PEP-CTERM motif